MSTSSVASCSTNCNKYRIIEALHKNTIQNLLQAVYVKYTEKSTINIMINNNKHTDSMEVIVGAVAGTVASADKAFGCR